MSRTCLSAILCVLVWTVLVSSCSKRKPASKGSDDNVEKRPSSNTAVTTLNKRPPKADDTEQRLAVAIERCLINPLKAPAEWQELVPRYNQAIEWLTEVPEWLDTESFDVDTLADEIEIYGKQLRAKAFFLQSIEPLLVKAGVRRIDLRDTCQVVDQITEQAKTAKKYMDLGLLPVQDIHRVVRRLKELADAKVVGSNSKLQANYLLEAFGGVNRVEVTAPIGTGTFQSIGAAHKWGSWHGVLHYYYWYDRIIVVDDPILEALRPPLEKFNGFLDYLCYKLSGLRFDLIMFVDIESANKFWREVSGDTMHIDGSETRQGFGLSRVFWPLEPSEHKKVRIEPYTYGDAWTGTSLLGSFGKGTVTFKRTSGGPNSSKAVRLTAYYGTEDFICVERKLLPGESFRYDLADCPISYHGNVARGPQISRGSTDFFRRLSDRDWLLSAWRETDGEEIIFSLTAKRGPAKNLYTYALRAENYILFYCPGECQLWSDWTESEKRLLDLLLTFLRK